MCNHASALLIAALLVASPGLGCEGERAETLPADAATSAIGAGTDAMLELPPRTGSKRWPVVMILRGADAADARSEDYAVALLRQGIAVLEIHAPDEAVLDRTFAWVAAHPRLDAARVGVLGFWDGARVSLAAGRGAVVALDPGCAGLALPREGVVLLVHGMAAPDAPACAALDGTPGLTRLALPGIGHGWDLSPFATLASALLPDPSGVGRRRVRPDPVAAEALAPIVAAWLATQLQRRLP
ncbi:dienelactone hydrolase family protein [Sabulicella glaciei]|uniref:Alpha/beta hydrolase n=1 Tax=Sabulicella glaciei TaxID=2984948 RepID=A0ABT3NVF7_9PROT|nr:hypothetical protein [Roseococcus sp. MDT2-1-1]MCW8086148.1 hypothetical protein [Roseococcus sp. MDT2-1-1]